MEKTNAFKNIGKSITKHSPAILTAIGIVSMGTSIVLAVKATPKAQAVLSDIKKKHECDTDKKELCKDTIKAIAPIYAPATFSFLVGTACILGANSVHAKRNAALAAAYTISDTAFKEYKEKVTETLGEKKEKKVREEVSKSRLEKDPVKPNTIYITEKGGTRFYDAMTKRRFTSDLEHLKKVANDLNRRMRSEMSISLNEFYDEIGLDRVPVGDILGWNIDRGYIDIEPDYIGDTDGTPCAVIDFRIRPDYNFD